MAPLFAVRVEQSMHINKEQERTNSTSPITSSYQRPRLLTAAQAADWLAVRESTVRDLARRGVIPSVKIGRLVRFIEADLVGYVEGLRGPWQAGLVDAAGRRAGLEGGGASPSTTKT